VYSFFRVNAVGRSLDAAQDALALDFPLLERPAVLGGHLRDLPGDVGVGLIDVGEDPLAERSRCARNRPMTRIFARSLFRLPPRRSASWAIQATKPF